ncbi:nucleotide exchange factor GrpE [Mycoplasma sp. ATU-Cv-703]|uniref:nucleotide exchange factor GrpE n=1 Tax=Mycoplasma sp. ATU-Cv-703 TaxID=2498595 RepID=UPI000FDE6A3B
MKKPPKSQKEPHKSPTRPKPKRQAGSKAAANNSAKKVSELQKEIKTLRASLTNLESQNLVLKLENQKNIADFQTKAKGFQTKAQAELEKAKQHLLRQVKEEKEQLRRYGSQPLVEKIIGPIVHIEQALQTGSEQKDPAVRAYLTGFKMLFDQLCEGLSEGGLIKIVPRVGEEFDPEIHHALSTEKKSGRANKIVSVKQVGYKLHDRVIKPAVVVVGS